MPEYHVVWKIDLTAANPRQAARLAQLMMRDQTGIATVFEVSLNCDGVLGRRHIIDSHGVVAS